MLPQRVGLRDLVQDPAALILALHVWCGELGSDDIYFGLQYTHAWKRDKVRSGHALRLVGMLLEGVDCEAACKHYVMAASAFRRCRERTSARQLLDEAGRVYGERIQSRALYLYERGFWEYLDGRYRDGVTLIYESAKHEKDCIAKLKIQSVAQKMQVMFLLNERVLERWDEALEQDIIASMSGHRAVFERESNWRGNRYSVRWFVEIACHEVHACGAFGRELSHALELLERAITEDKKDSNGMGNADVAMYATFMRGLISLHRGSYENAINSLRTAHDLIIEWDYSEYKGEVCVALAEALWLLDPIAQGHEIGRLIDEASADEWDHPGKAFARRFAKGPSTTGEATRWLFTQLEIDREQLQTWTRARLEAAQ